MTTRVRSSIKVFTNEDGRAEQPLKEVIHVPSSVRCNDIDMTFAETQYEKTMSHFPSPVFLGIAVGNKFSVFQNINTNVYSELQRKLHGLKRAPKKRITTTPNQSTASLKPRFPSDHSCQ